MRKLIIISMLVLLSVFSYSQSKNGGFTFPTNGPCTPETNMGGLCSDNGVMAVYGIDGILIHLPVAGPKGDKGLPGSDGVSPLVTIGTVATGFPGSQASVTNTGIAPNVLLNFSIPAGQAGLPGKDAVFPINVILSCQLNPTGGSIPKGFSASVCTLTKAP